MKHYLTSWSATQLTLLIASVIIIEIGCERRSKEVLDAQFKAVNFRPLDYAIRDTDYYDNNPYIPCTTGLCFGDEMEICQTSYYGYESKCWVQIAMYPILYHSELQPGY